ncbi:hypothetical protein M6D93_16430 [Jatrophihabitans telluris]|uniref:HPr kinase/phosphorylase C-terminal domain-containing protein n=1 Tax=Jatrophihabitans telluris TaxID=2038343 RepID=A0ABY4QW67_9ACTN|nr:hypothetical protein [Jatrophihabitans telluris]UQX87874.1 hypothetical protein M6D93_16430 [Jatrophihabitans telluris]
MLHTQAPVTDAALLHPYLGSTALAVAAWAGRCALHAGSFVGPDGVWGVLGEREDGKSSLLAWMVSHGMNVLADDLLITDGLTAMAGPRFIDLREGAARRFELGSDVGVLGTRRRWRVPLGPVPAELPVRGWIELAWGPDVQVQPIPISERMGVLARHKGLRFPVGDDVSLLHVLRLPAFRFSRPQDWDLMDTAMEQLLIALDVRR